MAKGFDVFSVRELRTRTGDLIRDAEEGRLSVITKHGRPAIISLPFDERLLAMGAHTTLALMLFRDGVLSMGQARKLSGMDTWEFTSLLSKAGIPAVDYDAAELEGELAVLESE